MPDIDFTSSEEFRPLASFPGYLMRSIGEVWSQWNTRKRPGKWHRVLGWKHKDGYQCVELSDADSVHHCKLVHVLVLEAFKGPCPPGMEGCHEDGDPQNNRIGNLAWKTHAENMQDAIRHGTFRFNHQIGSRHGHSKLTESDIPVIRGMLIRGMKQTEIAKSFGVDRYQIYSIKIGKTWAHVPYPIP